MIHLTKADADWLLKLLEIAEANYEDYPELYSVRDEEVLKIAGQLIRSIS